MTENNIVHSCPDFVNPKEQLYPGEKQKGRHFCFIVNGEVKLLFLPDGQILCIDQTCRDHVIEYLGYEVAGKTYP